MRDILARVLTEAKVVLQLWFGSFDFVILWRIATPESVPVEPKSHNGPCADPTRPSFFGDMAYRPHGSAELVQSIAILADTL